MPRKRNRYTNSVGRLYQRTKDDSDLARRSYQKQGTLKITLPDGTVKYFDDSFAYKRWKASQKR